MSPIAAASFYVQTKTDADVTSVCWPAVL